MVTMNGPVYSEDNLWTIFEEWLTDVVITTSDHATLAKSTVKVKFLEPNLTSKLVFTFS
jgi:hypothetical protein